MLVLNWQEYLLGMISLCLKVLLPLSPFLCLCSQVQDLPGLHRDSGVIQD